MFLLQTQFLGEFGKMFTLKLNIRQGII